MLWDTLHSILRDSTLIFVDLWVKLGGWCSDPVPALAKALSCMLWSWWAHENRLQAIHATVIFHLPLVFFFLVSCQVSDVEDTAVGQGAAEAFLIASKTIQHRSRSTVMNRLHSIKTKVATPPWKNQTPHQPYNVWFCTCLRPPCPYQLTFTLDMWWERSCHVKYWLKYTVEEVEHK